MNGLTKRQQQILQYIEDFFQQHHHAPSYREIMRYFGFTSVSSVAKHIDVLKNKGAIDKQTGRHRSLILAQPSGPPQTNGEIELPFIGHVVLGAPMELFTKTQSLALPRFLAPNPDITYILRVRGQNLGEEQMSDGDLLIVETRQQISSGELILSLSQGNLSAIHRYYPEGQHIRLESGSRTSTSLLVRPEDLRIQGVIIGLIRLYS